MSYLIDTNVFISSYRDLYPMDVFPRFWTELSRRAHQGQIYTIDKVRNEIYLNEDPLKEWCSNNLPDTFFLSVGGCVSEYSRLSDWAASMTQYKDYAKQVFLDADEADAWLIAYAMQSGFTIITNEKSAPGSQKSIKIPEPCIAHGVKYITLIDMMRAISITI